MNKREVIQKKATDIILDNKFNKVLLNIAPRVGKSKIIIDSLNKSNFDNIYISSPFIKIKENWENEIKKWGLKKNPILLCHNSLKKIKLSDKDVLIIDEVHTLSKNNIKTIVSFNTENIVGVTGSLSKETRKLLKDSLSLKELFVYSIDDAINDNIISDYEIYVKYCFLNDSHPIEVIRNKGIVKTTEKENYDYLTKIFENLKALSMFNPKLEFAKMKAAAKRADFIYSSKTKMYEAADIIKNIDRCLIYTARITVADALSDYSFHYKSTTQIEDFVSGKINRLSVVNLADMGLTFPNLKHAVIHQLQSNDETALQKILRMCNLEDKKKAKIYITVYKDTVDEEWMNKALSLMNKEKIFYL